MSHREALAEALEYHDHLGTGKNPIYEAARERLAQLPEKCGTCGGDGFAHRRTPTGGLEYGTCPTCHGRGTVYPPALVTTVKYVLKRYTALLDAEAERIAVAVLDALNEWKPE